MKFAKYFYPVLVEVFFA